MTLILLTVLQLLAHSLTLTCGLLEGRSFGLLKQCLLSAQSVVSTEHFMPTVVEDVAVILILLQLQSVKVFIRVSVYLRDLSPVNWHIMLQMLFWSQI